MCSTDITVTPQTQVPSAVAASSSDVRRRHGRETSLTHIIPSASRAAHDQHSDGDDMEVEPVFDGTFINVKENESDIVVGLPPDWTTAHLTNRIDEFNHRSHGLHMSLLHDGCTFRGFIRVHLDLHRPINMVAGSRPPSIFDVITSPAVSPPTSPADDGDTIKQSFYIPKGTVKALHITSETRAEEVIKALLNKFKVSDNPHKFALYEKITSPTNKYKYSLRRILDKERPLYMCLMWGGADIHQERFVLQENETGEIMWEAFSLPELQNFLTILNREEEEYEREVRHRYEMYSAKLHEEIIHRNHTDSSETCGKQDTETSHTSNSETSGKHDSETSGKHNSETNGTCENYHTEVFQESETVTGDKAVSRASYATVTRHHHHQRDVMCSDAAGHLEFVGSSDKHSSELGLQYDLHSGSITVLPAGGGVSGQRSGSATLPVSLHGMMQSPDESDC